MLTRLSLRLRLFLIFAGLAAGLEIALAAGLAIGWHRLADQPGALDGFVQGGAVAAFAILGLVAWIWSLFDLNVAKPIDRLAGALRARAHADVTGGMDAEIARYLGDLAPAAVAAAATLAETRNALAESVARETLQLSEEKSRLEALLSDVGLGVVLCSPEHQLVFYNSSAVDLMAAGVVPGLDRPLFDFLREGPVRLAYARLLAVGDPDAASDLLCTTVAGARVLSARMRLLTAPGAGDPGYVLTLRDVTADLAAHARREALLAEIFDRLRRPSASLSALMEVLPDGSVTPPRMEAALRQEVEVLARTVTELGRRDDEARGDGATLALTRAGDLADGLKARLEEAGLGLETRVADLILRCNGFEIISVLDQIALAIHRAGAQGLRLEIEEEDAGAMLRLVWRGAPLAVGDLDRWLDAPLDASVPEASCRQVLATHATEAWPETLAGGEHALCLPIRQARRAVARPRPVVRTVVYDFDLLARSRSDKVAETPLSDLTYVVFDTETTGLLPQQGDEIVQIAAVRIVNGRRVEGEVFDTLVNPGRPIPLSSTEVHGITQAMVADAPGPAEVVARFHKFSQGAVLIAHNAPFDMQFLRRHERAPDLVFGNPVLDTVLLSAVIYGQHEVHSLDALTHRLGITIPEEARHTAIGDTVATADAFLKLMPMLKGRGFSTFGDVLVEVRKHGRLLKDLN
ncbi:3'-5' exonuclease [Xinfangfangia pollutisoli]|uniref:3'-5' exonuclease n=1 Tax=Xinfangfangia pollutisoli TaxID=2865960 RepID=UPI001CD4173D|nr:exonuclease domain-containing protein [Xinfangfangia pollutisoli]